MTNQEVIRVLQAIKEHPSMGVYLPDEYEALDLAIKALEERPQGEWIKDKQGNTICSNCGFECLYSEDGFLYSLGNYCHHCGAKMQKGGKANG